MKRNRPHVARQLLRDPRLPPPARSKRSAATATGAPAAIRRGPPQRRTTPAAKPEARRPPEAAPTRPAARSIAASAGTPRATTAASAEASAGRSRAACAACPPPSRDRPHPGKNQEARVDHHQVSAAAAGPVGPSDPVVPARERLRRRLEQQASQLASLPVGDPRARAGGELVEHPTHDFGFRLVDPALAPYGIARLVDRLHHVVAVAQPAAGATLLDTVAQSQVRLGREVLQEQRVHRPLEPDMELADFALGERHHRHPGKAQVLVQRRHVRLVPAHSVQRLRPPRHRTSPALCPPEASGRRGAGSSCRRRSPRRGSIRRPSSRASVMTAASIRASVPPLSFAAMPRATVNSRSSLSECLNQNFSKSI